MSRRFPVTRVRTALLLLLAVFLAGVALGSPQDQEPGEEEQRRWGYEGKLPNWTFTEVYRKQGVADLRDLDADKQKQAVKLIHDQLDRFQRSGNTGDIAEIFRSHSFEEVSEIAKDGLDEDTSRKLAEARRRMIQDAMAEAVRKIDPSGKLSIGMLDSGNKRSGIASDVDQTLFILPKDLARRLGISEARVIKQFNDDFKAANGVEPGRLGVESMNGADMFPDWRQQHTVLEFGAEADRVTGEKIKDIRAYQSEGQLKSQVERRGYEELQKHHQRVNAVNTAEKAIENLQGRIDLGEAERAAKIAEAEARLLRQMADEYPDAKNRDDLKRRIAQDAPWTEVRWDPLRGEAEIDPLRDPTKRAVLTDRPYLMERYAFDGAYDNHLMFERHPANRGKYLLRSFSEGASLRREGAGDTVTPLEYEKLFAAGDKAGMRAILKQVYPEATPAELEKYRRAMDVAAMQRLKHKGTKNPATGQEFTNKDIYAEYLPELTAAEQKMYQGMGDEALDKLRTEKAQRQWEVDARGLMIENLVRTVTAPNAIMQGNISDAELKKIQEKFPLASREKLRIAAQKQVRNGLAAAMSLETAKYLSLPPAVRANTPKPVDLSMRMLDRLGWQNDSLEGQRLREAALDAANWRIAHQPGLREFRNTYLGDMLERVKARVINAKGIYREVRKNYDDGKYPKEYVAEKLLQAASDRWDTTWMGLKDAFGYEIKPHIPLNEKGFPDIELEFGKQTWSASKLASNMASAGNLDSVLQIALAYQEGGKQAAAEAAAFEVVMNIPPLAKLNAVNDLLHGNPQGVVMMGSAMAVPVLGQAYMFISIGKTSVMLAGNYVVAELSSDAADKMYQGYLDESSGFTKTVRSQRVSLLHHVPIRVLTIPVQVKNKQGQDVTRPHPVWRPFDALEAHRLFSVFDDEYDWMYQGDVLGEVDKWKRHYAEVASESENPRKHFDAKRVSMYYYYRDRFGQRLDELLSPKGLEIDDPGAMPLLEQFFLERIEDWVDAKGEFAGFGENLIISRRFRNERGLRPEVVNPIAQRAANDLVNSYRIIQSIEENVQNAVFKARDDSKHREGMALLWGAIEMRDRQPGLDPGTTDAVRRAILERPGPGVRHNEPRMHVRPRVVWETDERGALRHRVKLAVSVIANPEAYPPLEPAKGYFYEVKWLTEMQQENQGKVTAQITVFNGKDPARREILIGPERFEIGEVKLPKPLPTKTEMKVSMSKQVPVDEPAVTAGTPGQQPQAQPKPGVPPQPKTQKRTVYADYDKNKASSWGDQWGEEAVSNLRGEMWVRWKECPLGVYYYYETRITGGSPPYKDEIHGALDPRFSYPDLAPGESFLNEQDLTGEVPDFEAEDVRPNIFIVPFSWPQGYVGDFRVKGRILAFAQEYAGDAWRQAKPLAVFPFEESFSIKDEREDDAVALWVKYTRKVVKPRPAETARKSPPDTKVATPAPPAKPVILAKPEAKPPISPEGDKASGKETAKVKTGRTKRGRSRRRAPAQPSPTITDYETHYERFDPLKATPWNRWDDDPANAVRNLEIRVNWREVPPNESYYIDVTVHGGIPQYRHVVQGKPINAVDGYPPHKDKPGPGTHFALELPWPRGHAEKLSVEGKIYAVARGAALPRSGEVENTIAEYPFKRGFRIQRLPRGGSGNVEVAGSNMARGYFRLFGLQEGRRVARVKAGKRTFHALLRTGSLKDNGYEGSLNFVVPVNERFDEIEVTFRDFGKPVRLALPVKQFRGRIEVPAFEPACLDRARDYRKGESGKSLAAWRLRLKSMCYSGPAQFDRGAFQKMKQYQLESRSLYLQLAEEEGGEPFGIWPYDELFDHAVRAGDLDEANSLSQKLESLHAAGNALDYRYKQYAELVFRGTGDLERAKAAWEKYVNLTRRVRPKAPANELRFPWDTDPGFELQ